SVVSIVLGFGFLGAGKTMGLASYGRAAGMEPWELIDDDLSPPFDHDDESSHEEVLQGWRRHIAALVGRDCFGTDPDQLADEPDAVRLAWSAQWTVERAMDRLVGLARAETGIEQVCLAGGVALNCLANARLAGPVFAPPVPHDAGVALGAA